MEETFPARKKWHEKDCEKEEKRKKLQGRRDMKKTARKNSHKKDCKKKKREKECEQEETRRRLQRSGQKL